MKARRRLWRGIDPDIRRDDLRLRIHRFYTEKFLEEFSHDIKGHCLEFLEDKYASRFGGKKVTKVDILHKTCGNPQATLVADLTKPNGIPSDSFDCIICTYTIHVVFDFGSFVQSLYRILKPGGVLLLVAPCIIMNTAEQEELYRFTTLGLSEVLKTSFEPKKIDTQSFGNSLSACCDLRVLFADELIPEELNARDSRYCVTAAARAQK